MDGQICVVGRERSVTFGGGGTFGWLLGSGKGTDTGSAPFEMMQWPAASEEKSKPSWHMGSCWVAEMLVNRLEKETLPANGSLFSFGCTNNVRQLSSKARKTKGSFTSPPFLKQNNQLIFVSKNLRVDVG